MLVRRFADRVLGFDEVRSLELNPARATATVSYHLANGAADTFLVRLADAVAGDRFAIAGETELPHWTDGEPVTLYRHAGVVSIFAELHIASGCLTARHPALESTPTAARRVEDALRVLPGVIEVAATSATRRLRVRFDPNAVAALQLIRIAEQEILERETIRPVTSPEPVNFRLENVMVGVAAVGEFVLPLMAPPLLNFASAGLASRCSTVVPSARGSPAANSSPPPCCRGSSATGNIAIDRMSRSRTATCLTKPQPCRNRRGL